MKKQFLLMILAMVFFAFRCDTTPSDTGTWQKMYGGFSTDYAYSIQQTSDGGYIVAGYSESTNISGVTNHGGYDVYIIKLDSNGDIVWQQMYGSSGEDYAYSIQQTSDGGYIISGSSVIKLDSEGNIVWQNTNIGGNSIQQTSDGGYIVAGTSSSTDISGAANNGETDVYIIKLDSNGYIVWQKMLGGSNIDQATSMQQTNDGGYIIAGYSESTNISGAINHGGIDVYLIKLDGNGDIVWQQMYGGSDGDFAQSIQQTSDGGYIVAGFSKSTDISGVTCNGTRDYYIIKIDIDGNIVWQKMYGGSDMDQAYSVHQTSDGGYVVAGWSNSKDISGLTNNNYDIYLIKLDSDGNLVWQKMYGGTSSGIHLGEYCVPFVICIPLPNEGTSFDFANSVQQTSDGGYIVAGYSNGIDISGATNHGYNDYYVLKLDANGDL